MRLLALSFSITVLVALGCGDSHSYSDALVSSARAQRALPALEQKDNAESRECWEWVMDTCTELGGSDMECLDMANDVCSGDEGDDDGDCFESVLDLCAEAGNSDTFCYDLAILECGGDDDGDEGDDDCWESVLDLCAESGNSDTFCYDLALLECSEPNKVGP